jgi:hypothetical protein
VRLKDGWRNARGSGPPFRSQKLDSVRLARYE